MTAEREKAINEWLGIHCRMCANNDDRGTDLINCQAECEVEKDVGIACIHFEETFEHHWEMMDDIEREEYNALWSESEDER